MSTDQLRPGVFISLDAHWFSHPFLFSKFKIKDYEQIKALKDLGIKDVCYIPEKSDCLPKRRVEVCEEESGDVCSAEEDPYVQFLWKIKNDRMNRLKEKRESLSRCSNNYNKAVKYVPDLMTRMLTGSKEAVAASQMVVGAMVRVFWRMLTL